VKTEADINRGGSHRWTTERYQMIGFFRFSNWLTVSQFD
jgi:hypothetical protein